MSGRREQFGLSPQNPMRTQPIIRLGVNRAASASNQKPSSSANIAIEAHVQYKPLDFETYEIRLLRLQWGSENIGDIHCSLEHASLINPGPYIALSYCWGNFGDAKHIYVDGVKYKATVNLVSALQTIRKLKRNTGDGAFTRLWVDAICINQNDLQERIWMGGITVQEESLLKSQDIRNINPILAGSTGLQLKVRGTLIGTVTHLTSAMRPHSRDSKPLPPRAPWIDSTATLAAKITELGSPSPDVSKFLLTIWYELLLS
ncbi:uncharacterized protein RSE6_13967 [Rhynchosporium secalis]|uniref:Heterokaryon incompatibility domain-containing protein n=1 Tax=Rhynchosporium secalis TaxID=38038 RepID=A0A1E1MUW8_RHYSE|nr:uncharacterized protein RSE6_13967 [Rhynchosporium secalis]